MKSLQAYKTIVFHTMLEQWKNRFFHLVLVFGAVLIYAALVLGAMAVEQEERVLLNFGFGLIELIGLATVLLGCASVILRDMETKNIYLLLSRPLPRWAYIMGRYDGIVASVGIGMAVMGGALALLLVLKGFGLYLVYAKILFASWLKICVVGALTLLVSLISTSVLSAVVISGICWTLGHFLAEIRYISERMGGITAIVSKPVLFVMPDMSMFRLNDALNAVPPAGPGLLMAFFYAGVYVIACLSLSILAFRKKEF